MEVIIEMFLAFFAASKIEICLSDNVASMSAKVFF